MVTDHKPLTKLLGERTLDEIQNTRLFRLKQRTLPWYFKIHHMPGKSNFTADAMSRYPASTDTASSLEHGDHQESALLSSIKADASVNFSVPWSTISRETLKDEALCTIMKYITSGFPEHLPDQPRMLKSYWRHKEAFYITDGVLMYNDRIVVPPSLRQQVLSTLHAAHQGVSSMESRARSTVFWPGLINDISATRAACQECNKIAPSQPHLPPAPYDPPTTPFEKIVADFFHFGGWYYLVVADRLSGWPEAFKCDQGSSQSGADGLISCLRQCFAVFGVPTEISSDGGPEFTAHRTADFLKKWDIHHRLSSSYHPQSNGRAEVAVKTMKRLLRSNTNSDGSLNNDNFLRAILQLRNTPDPDCDLSPAQIVFGRPLRDAFSFVNRLEKFTNPNILPTWRQAWREKESALRQRYHRTSEALKTHAKQLPPLDVGDRCYVQNQCGNYPTRWDRSGRVVDIHDHDSYLVKVDGSGRLTKRNRQFLRKFTPPTFDINTSENRHDAQIPVNLTNMPLSATSVKEIHLPAPVIDADIASTPPATPPATPKQVQKPVTCNSTNDQMVVPLTSREPSSTSVTQPDLTVTPPSGTLELTRPRRATKAPRLYEPETGKWI